ncbi:hypothetical protein AAG570_000391 [Ranatra chinensis]|uniref:Smoothelin domain-containing protein n=1 Tax=Ranatra chinensis TaxID=642074 RepID=A0ABD0ZK80_9HEMI
MAAEISADLSLIHDEDILRRMWADTEDFGRKKEIRARMYKLREQRLRDFYTTGEVVSEMAGRKHTSTTHAESIGDQGFLTMKSKEIRDSESPTRDFNRGGENNYWTTAKETTYITQGEDGAVIESRAASEEVQGSRVDGNTRSQLSMAKQQLHETSSKSDENMSSKSETQSRNSRIATSGVTHDEYGNTTTVSNQRQQQQQSSSTSKTEQHTSSSTRMVSSSSSSSSKKIVSSSSQSYQITPGGEIRAITNVDTNESRPSYDNRARDTYDTQNTSHDSQTFDRVRQVRSNETVSEQTNKTTRNTDTTDFTNITDTRRFEDERIDRTSKEDQINYRNRTDVSHSDETEVTKILQRNDRDHRTVQRLSDDYATENTDQNYQRVVRTRYIDDQTDKDYNYDDHDVNKTITTEYRTVERDNTDVRRRTDARTVESETVNVNTDQKIMSEIQKLDTYLSSQNTPGASTPVSPHSVSDASSWTIVSNTDGEFIYQADKTPDNSSKAPPEIYERPTPRKHPSTLELPKETTEGQYVTTYQHSYTRISVDNSPTHEFFAKTLRASPDRSTPSPTKRTSSKGSLDSRSSPERKYPRGSPTAKTPEKERRVSVGSYTIEKPQDTTRKISDTTRYTSTVNKETTKTKRKLSSTQAKLANKTRVSTPGASPSTSPTRPTHHKVTSSDTDSDASQQTYDKTKPSGMNKSDKTIKKDVKVLKSTTTVDTRTTDIYGTYDRKKKTIDDRKKSPSPISKKTVPREGSSSPTGKSPTSKRPETGGKAPSPTRKIPTEREKSPMKTNKRPEDREDSPAPTSKRPAETQELSSPTRKKPETHEETPTATIKRPGGTEELPTPNDIKSGSQEEEPASVGKRPEEQEPTPANKKPVTHGDAPRPISKRLDEREESPTPTISKKPDESEETPTPASKKTVTHGDAPTPVSKRPDGREESPTPASKKTATLEGTPSPIGKRPDEREVSPTPAGKKKVPHGDTPTPISKRPDEREESPTPAIKKAVPQGETPTPISKRPDEHEVSPTAGNKKPTTQGQTPMSQIKRPGKPDDTPISTSERPGVREDTPSPVSQKSRIREKSPDYSSEGSVSRELKNVIVSRNAYPDSSPERNVFEPIETVRELTNIDRTSTMISEEQEHIIKTVASEVEDTREMPGKVNSIPLAKKKEPLSEKEPSLGSAPETKGKRIPDSQVPKYKPVEDITEKYPKTFKSPSSTEQPTPSTPQQIHERPEQKGKPDQVTPSKQSVPESTMEVPHSTPSSSPERDSQYIQKPTPLEGAPHINRRTPSPQRDTTKLIQEEQRISKATSETHPKTIMKKQSPSSQSPIDKTGNRVSSTSSSPERTSIKKNKSPRASPEQPERKESSPRRRPDRLSDESPSRESPERTLKKPQDSPKKSPQGDRKKLPTQSPEKVIRRSDQRPKEIQDRIPKKRTPSPVRRRPSSPSRSPDRTRRGSPMAPDKLVKKRTSTETIKKQTIVQNDTVLRREQSPMSSPERTPHQRPYRPTPGSDDDTRKSSSPYSSPERTPVRKQRPSASPESPTTRKQPLTTSPESNIRKAVPSPSRGRIPQRTQTPQRPGPKDQKPRPKPSDEVQDITNKQRRITETRSTVKTTDSVTRKMVDKKDSIEPKTITRITRRSSIPRAETKLSPKTSKENVQPKSITRIVPSREKQPNERQSYPSPQNKVTKTVTTVTTTVEKTRHTPVRKPTPAVTKPMPTTQLRKYNEVPKKGRMPVDHKVTTEKPTHRGLSKRPLDEIQKPKPRRIVREVDDETDEREYSSTSDNEDINITDTQFITSESVNVSSVTNVRTTDTTDFVEHERVTREIENLEDESPPDEFYADIEDEPKTVSKKTPKETIIKPAPGRKQPTMVPVSNETSEKRIITRTQTKEETDYTRGVKGTPKFVPKYQTPAKQDTKFSPQTKPSKPKPNQVAPKTPKSAPLTDRKPTPKAKTPLGAEKTPLKKILQKPKRDGSPSSSSEDEEETVAIVQKVESVVNKQNYVEEMEVRTSKIEEEEDTRGTIITSQDNLRVIVQHPKSSRESSPDYPSRSIPVSATSDDGESVPRYADYISEPEDVEIFDYSRLGPRMPVPGSEHKPKQVTDLDDDTDTDVKLDVSVAERVSTFMEKTKKKTEKVPQEASPAISSPASVRKTKAMFENIAKNQTTPSSPSPKKIDVVDSRKEPKRHPTKVQPEYETEVEERHSVSRIRDQRAVNVSIHESVTQETVSRDISEIEEFKEHEYPDDIESTDEQIEEVEAIRKTTKKQVKTTTETQQKEKSPSPHREPLQKQRNIPDETQPNKPIITSVDISSKKAFFERKVSDQKPKKDTPLRSTPSQRVEPKPDRELARTDVRRSTFKTDSQTIITEHEVIETDEEYPERPRAHASSPARSSHRGSPEKSPSRRTGPTDSPDRTTPRKVSVEKRSPERTVQQKEPFDKSPERKVQRKGPIDMRSPDRSAPRKELVDKRSPERVIPRKESVERGSPERVLPRKESVKKTSPERIIPRKESVERRSPERVLPRKESVEKRTIERVVTRKESVEKRSPERVIPRKVSVEKRSPERVLPRKESVEKRSPERVLPRKESIDKGSPERSIPRKESVDRKSPERSPLKARDTNVVKKVEQEPSRVGDKFGVTLRRTSSSKEVPLPSNRKPSAPGDQPEIEDIIQLELLEEMLLKAVAYDERRRIRAQIRLVKRQLEESSTTSVTQKVSKTIHPTSTPKRPQERVPDRSSPSRKDQTRKMTGELIQREAETIVSETTDILDYEEQPTDPRRRPQSPGARTETRTIESVKTYRKSPEKVVTTIVKTQKVTPTQQRPSERIPSRESPERGTDTKRVKSTTTVETVTTQRQWRESPGTSPERRRPSKQESPERSTPRIKPGQSPERRSSTPRTSRTIESVKSYRKSPERKHPEMPEESHPDTKTKPSESPERRESLPKTSTTIESVTSYRKSPERTRTEELPESAHRRTSATTKQSAVESRTTYETTSTGE